MKKYIAVAVLMLGLCGIAVAYTQVPTDCPHGYHCVRPPCYYDESGNRVCPDEYCVCN